jgi:hypothetical protein
VSRFRNLIKSRFFYFSLFISSSLPQIAFRHFTTGEVCLVKNLLVSEIPSLELRKAYAIEFSIVWGVERRQGEKNVCADEITKQLKCSEDNKTALGQGENTGGNTEIKKIFLNHNRLNH